MNKKQKDKIIHEYLKRQADNGLEQLQKIMKQVWAKRTNSIMQQSLNKEISFDDMNNEEWFQKLNQEIQNKKTMSLSENLKKVTKDIKEVDSKKKIKEGTIVSSKELKQYIDGEDKLKQPKFDKVSDETPKKKKEKFSPIEESKGLLDNLVQTSIKSKILTESVVQVDMPNEIMNSVDAGKLPKFITIGDTAYIYSGSSSPDLYKIMTCDKGVIGKIIYTQSDVEIDNTKPKEIEIEIIKVPAQKKTILSIGSVNVK